MHGRDRLDDAASAAHSCMPAGHHDQLARDGSPLWPPPGEIMHKQPRECVRKFPHVSEFGQPQILPKVGCVSSLLTTGRITPIRRSPSAMSPGT